MWLKCVLVWIVFNFLIVWFLLIVFFFFREFFSWLIDNIIVIINLFYFKWKIKLKRLLFGFFLKENEWFVKFYVYLWFFYIENDIIVMIKICSICEEERMKVWENGKGF